jgi:hypothetical protein
MSEGPKPFSSEWLNAPAAPPEPPRRLNKRTSQRLVAGFAKLPGERVLSMLVVLVLIFSSFWFASPRGEAQVQTAELGAPTPAAQLAFKETPPPTTEADISTDSLTLTDEGMGDGGAALDRTPTGPKLNLEPTKDPQQADGALLPEYRLLLFYGFPDNEQMGILGEYDKQRLLELLQEQAAAYEEADPSRPVKIAFEVIASVAQAEPQNDGSYLLDAPTELLNDYADFAEANDILLFLDVQIGRRTVKSEVEGLRPWLEKPFVHLAIDPEFAMRKGETPGLHIGQVDAADITWSQQYLADLSKEAGIPPKVLIVHQFQYSMIENKDKVAAVAGVQLVIDMDGWGAPDLKRSTYDAVITQQPIEFHGVKLFYKQDVPLMSPEEVLDLSPVPDLIIYQ